MTFRLVIMLLLACFVMNSVAGAADGSSGTGKFDFRTKAKNKEGSRWTLSEWLQQKERNHLMDLWLAMYAPSPYEFYLGGNYMTYKTSTEPTTSETSFASGEGQVGAFATVLGVAGDYQNNLDEKFNDLSGSVQLRILGNAVQGTHLIVFYGNRNRTMEKNGTVSFLRNPYTGGDLNLYFNKHLGISGEYRSYQPFDDTTLGTVTGSRTQGGVFIDFGSLRISGEYFQDQQDQSLTGVKTSTIRTGVKSGLRFYF